MIADRNDLGKILVLLVVANIRNTLQYGFHKIALQSNDFYPIGSSIEL